MRATTPARAVLLKRNLRLQQIMLAVVLILVFVLWGWGAQAERRGFLEGCSWTCIGLYGADAESCARFCGQSNYARQQGFTPSPPASCQRTP